MGKIIYIKSDEEITSVIDKLVKSKDKEIFLVVPKAAVLSQSSVNLKLLKREASNLDKKITFVSQDPVLQRLAKKIDFFVSDSLEQESVREEASGPEEEQEETILHEPIPEDKFEELLNEEKKSSPLRIFDIVKSDVAPKGKLISNWPNESQNTKSRKINETKEIQVSAFKDSGSDAGSEETQISNEDSWPIFDEETFKNPRYDFLRPKDRKTPADFFKARETGRQEKNQPASSDKSFTFSFPGKIFALFIVSSLIIAVLLSFLILPKAEVLVLAKRENLPYDMKILVDKNLAQPNFSEGKIPGQLLKLEDKISSEFQTSGQRQLNEKAKGIITVYNAYSSSPQTLVETTRFLSPDGLVFRLLKTVTIPGAKIEEGRIVANSIDVAVEADQPGGEYNIGPTNFTIPGFKGSPKYDGFYGKSKNEITGGSTENVRVLTQDDFNKAKSQAEKSLKEKINTELSTQIPQGFTLLDGAVLIELAQAQPSVEIGGKAEKFSVSLKGVAKAIIFSQENILLLLGNKLILSSEQKNFSNKQSIVYENIKADFEKGQLNFKIKGEQEVILKINPEEIKALIAGKEESQVREIFARKPEIQEAQFSLWPFWVKQIPAQKEKIKVTIE